MVRFVPVLLVLAFPASAEPWLVGEMVEAGPHPRTVIHEGELATVHDRLGREPYRTLLSSIVSWAATEGDLDDHGIDAEESKANAARAAAWLFYADRTVDADGAPVPFADEAARRDMGDKAATYLLSMYTVSRAKGLIEFTDDIHTAQELHLWAETLDLLLGADLDVLGADREAAIQGVADLAADLYADFNLTNWIACRVLINNHRSKTASALGIAAIVLNGETFEDTAGDGRYDPAAWIDFAVRNVDFVLRDILTDPDGGYMEGGGYLGYSAIDHAGFEWAWHRYTGGASYVATFDEPVPPYYVLGATEPYVIPNLWDDDAVQRQLEWGVRVMLPDGTFPPADDSTPGSRLFWGAFVGAEFEHAGLFRWAWERGGQSAGGSVDTAPLILAAYDDGIPAVTPEAAGFTRHQVLPRAGQVVFRSGWGTDDVCAVMQCEHGRAAALAQTRWGQFIDGAAGHEHPDPLSVMLYAGGEPLIIDSGYLGWDDHAAVWDPTHHNIVLVDGEGPAMPYLSVPPLGIGTDGELVLLDYTVEGGYVAPDDGQAYLLASDVGSEAVAYADAVTRYRILTPTTDLWRRAVLLGDRFLVLHDRVELAEDDGASHTFTHTLHTNCGGDSGGEYAQTDQVATCGRDGARLRIAVLSPGATEQTTREDVHDAGFWARRTHTVLETSVEATGDERVEFLSLLLPEPAAGDGYDEVDLAVTGCAGACGSWEVGGTWCEAWLGETREISTPDGTAIVEADSGAYCMDETTLAGWSSVAEIGAELSLSAQLTGDGAVADWRVAVHALDGDRGVLHLPAPPERQPDGACSFAEDGGGGWEVEIAAPSVVETTASARDVVAVARIEGLSLDEPAVIGLGATVRLDGSGSCGPGVENATHVWALVTRPELSHAELAGDAASVEMVPDLPGLYRAELTVTSEDSRDTAHVEFEVEGEVDLVDDGGDDDDSAAPADEDAPAYNANPAGCGCRVASRRGGSLALFGCILMGAAWRRGRRGPTMRIAVLLSMLGFAICGCPEGGGGGDPAITWAQVEAGNVHSCAVDTAGVVDCWGCQPIEGFDVNDYGQCGDPEGAYAQVSAGQAHSCALAADGSVSCWGCGTDTLPFDFGQCEAPEGSFSQVSAGAFHSCAVDGAGAVTCWGCLPSKELPSTRSDWGQCTPPEGTFVEVSAGYHHTCGLTEEGGSVCWGGGDDSDDHGQCSSEISTFAQVAAGVSHSCGVTADGAVMCWGCDDTDQGQCTPPEGAFEQVSVGRYHSCARAADGSVSCWGCDDSIADRGQCDVPQGFADQVSAGSLHTCAITSVGDLICWGSDAAGQAQPGG